MDHLFEILTAALANKTRLARALRHQIGPGKNTHSHGRSSYTGAMLREIRRLNGVGRPSMVKSVAQARALEEWQLQAMRRGVSELVAAKRASAA